MNGLLWFHPWVPPHIITHPKLQVAHAGYWVKDVIGVAAVERVAEVLRLAVHI